MTSEERTWMITKLEKYKNSLKKREISLLEELSRYQENSSTNEDEDIGDFKDIEYDIYNNPYETYLVAQIRIVKALPSLLEKHMICIEKGTDLDQILGSLEFEIYKVKKKVYINVQEWEDLLTHLSDQRRLEIKNNPKGPGDLIIKELCWIEDYEEKWK